MHCASNSFGTVARHLASGTSPGGPVQVAPAQGLHIEISLCAGVLCAFTTFAVPPRIVKHATGWISTGRKTGPQVVTVLTPSALRVPRQQRRAFHDPQHQHCQCMHVQWAQWASGLQGLDQNMSFISS